MTNMLATLPKLSTAQDTTHPQRPGSLNKVAGATGVTMEKIDATAKDFEAQFISQMLESMFSTTDAKDGLGGSEAEETYQSMMVQEYGKVIARTGGIGIADDIKRSMLKLQEMNHGAPAA